MKPLFLNLNLKLVYVFAIVFLSLNYSFAQDEHMNEKIKFYMPNAFTPNGDGLNDRFQVHLNHYKSFRLSIFNRRGIKVFETNNPYESWDGTDKNGVSYPVQSFLVCVDINTGDRVEHKRGFLILMK